MYLSSFCFILNRRGLWTKQQQQQRYWWYAKEGGYYWTGFLLHQSISCCITGPALARSSCVNSIPGNIQKGDPELGRKISPKNVIRKTRKKKFRKKKETGKTKQKQKIEDPATNHNNLLRHGSHFHSSQWPKEDKRIKKKKRKETERRGGRNTENC